MAQRLVTDFINTPIPGAYIKTNVISNPVGLGASGIVVIIGEATGGPSYSQVTLKNNYFTPDQLDQVTTTYLSGPIVDAFRALSAPSNDANIVGTANVVYIIKTNTSAKASATVDTNYGTLTDQNYGLPGNAYKFQVTSTASETAPAIIGSTIATFGSVLNGAAFSVRQNGGAVSTVTLGTTSASHSSAATLAAELNTLLPAGLTASAGAIANSIALTAAVDASANHRGSGKSVELIDSMVGELAALGLLAGQYSSAQEPAIEIKTTRSDIGVNETLSAKASIALAVGYAGTAATMTISKSGKTLATTVTGGAGANLAIDLSQYNTLADLATFIASQPGYTATAAAAAQQLATSALDSVSAIGIGSSNGNAPGRVKSSAYNFALALSTSHSLNFAAIAEAGLPLPSAPAFLAGGTKGGTLSSDILNAVTQLQSVQCNIVVPLFSQDATADIAAGGTDSSSAYTIDAIHALVKNHCIEYSTPKLKRNRIAILSYWGSYAIAKVKAQTLANYRCSLTFQKCTQVNSAGNSQVFLPWYGAVVAAGMQAGGFYKAIVNKFANVISFQDPSDFDSGSPGNVEDALLAGMLLLTHVTAGNRWVSDQTTYGYDTNFVYNSIQAVYLSDIIALDLAESFQSTFVGKSLADVEAATALSFLATKMDGYKKLKMIATSDDAPLGYKNAKISINAPEMSVSVEIKLATAIYFIPISLSLSQVQQTA